MGILLPPPQYDHPPTIPVIEQVLPWTEIQKICFNLALKWNGATSANFVRSHGVDGCSGIFDDGKCYVWRIDDADVKRHEMAHCSGWPKDHPK